jgi:hypothetical protein
MSSYAICVIADEHKNAINRVFNLLNRDTGDNLSQPLSANGQSPASHWYGGWPVTAEQANALQTLAENLPVPPSGWPYEGVSEATAQAAVEALYTNINTGENAEAIPEQNRATVFAALGLRPVAFQF